MTVTCKQIALEDGRGIWMQPGVVEVRQEDPTLSRKRGTSVTQSQVWERAELRRIQRAALHGVDWRKGKDRAYHMGDGLIVVEQVDPEAHHRGCPSIHQRTVLTLADLDALLALAGTTEAA